MEKKAAQGLPFTTEAQAQAARERKRAYYAANPEKYRAISRENRTKNPAQAYASSRAARLKNPEAARKYAISYYRQNASAIRPRHAAQAMKRYAGRRKATPAWVDLTAIRFVYDEAARITEESGEQHQVDHIVPLMGRTVCGLHVPWNLQVITKPENIKKGNRVWPDMP